MGTTVGVDAVDLPQIPMSPQLGATLARASELAASTGSSEVTLEHLLAALCDDADAGAVLEASSIDINRLKGEVAGYLQRIGGGGEEPGGQLAVSADVRRILEAAAQASRGSRRRDINGAIVLAAIVGDGRSTAAAILQSLGLTFENAIRALQSALTSAAAAEPPAPVAVADDVLARARERVQSRAAPSLRDIMRDMPAQPAPALPPAQYQPPPAQPAPPAAAPPAPSSPNERIEPTLSSAPAPASEYSLPPEPQFSAPDGKPPPFAPGPHDQSSSPEPTLPPLPVTVSRGAPVAEQPAARNTTPPTAGYPTPEHVAPPPPRPPVANPAVPPPPPPGFGGPGGAAAHPPMPDLSRRPAGPHLPPPIPPPLSSPAPMARTATADARDGWTPPVPQPSARAPGFGPPPPAPPPPNVALAPADRSATRDRKPPAARIENGQLAENIPRSMRVGRTDRAEVRIGKAAVASIAEGLEGGGAAWRHSVVVTKAMSVRLRSPDGAFFIESASPETQWIEGNLGYASDDFASWRFSITPKTRGKSRLQIIVSARTVGADGVAAETALPDQLVEVKVKSDVRRAFWRLAGWAIAAIAGGALATFGESGAGFARVLIARFIE